MRCTTSFPSISFFKIEKYEYQHEKIHDFSDCPRPHYCMGLIISGEADFKFDDESVHVVPGDLIFVPISSKYISFWNGNPDILYITMHFSFESPGPFSRNKLFKIQKITLGNFEELKENFIYTFENFGNGTEGSLKAIGIFYSLLGCIYPKLKFFKMQKLDSRIEKAVDYIEHNYANDFTVEQLAQLCNMSTSYFHSSFKRAMGLSPIEYKHTVCINHAILRLIGSEKLSIEEISGSLGFYSSTYFRRIFKKITGKSPREYRKTNLEN